MLGTLEKVDPAFRADVLSGLAAPIPAIPARWWRSVHGRTWGIRADSPIVSPGNAGLSLGHWHLWQHLYESGVEEAIICEDDVVFPADFRERFAAARATTAAAVVAVAAAVVLLLRRVLVVIWAYRK